MFWVFVSPAFAYTPTLLSAKTDDENNLVIKLFMATIYLLFLIFCRCTLWAQEKCHNSLLQSFNLLCQLNNDHSFVRPKMNIAKFYWIPRAFEFECVVSYNISNFIVLIICFICCCSFQRSQAILKSSRLIPKCTIQTHMFVYTYTNTLI